MIVAIAFGLIGLALAIGGALLALGRIPRNGHFGLRTGETLADDDVWYAANSRTGRDVIVLGLVVAAWGLSNLLWQPTSNPFLDVLIATAIVVTGAFVVALRGISFATRYKARRNKPISRM